MCRHDEVRAATDRLDRLLQRLACKGREFPAVLTDEVVMVLVGIEPLVACGVTADVDTLDQMQVLELLQGSVNRGPAHGVEPPVYLQGGQGATLRAEQFDYLSPGPATAESGFFQTARRQLDPMHGRHAIR